MIESDFLGLLQVTISRAEVAAALAELRAELVAAQYPIRDGMSEKEKCVNVGLIAAIHRTDATIAKLGCDATRNDD